MTSLSRTARAAAAVAFGPGAAVYRLLTGHAAWRADCQAMAALVTGPRVLDLGVGPGTSALEMARAAPAQRYVGLDREGSMLRLARGAARAAGVPLPLVRADALALPFAAGSLDGATGHSFLYLLPDPAAALAEVRRVLRPGGAAVFLEPRAGPASLSAAAREGARCAASMVLWLAMARLHRRFDEAGLAALLAASGFAEARAWPVLFGFGVMAVGRIATARRDAALPADAFGPGLR
jgi:SAM-dependent methyltransferase